MVMQRQIDRSVVDQPDYEEGSYVPFVLWLGSIADDITQWGGSYGNFRIRDVQLRNFWISEPALASALYTITIRDAAFSWTIRGDQPRTVKMVQQMLHNANLGKGWLDFITKWRLDYLTQDNGAFFEIIRMSDSPDSPVIGINHLDAGRCRRTGVPEWPVIYEDRKGRQHKLAPHQVIATSDFSSPIETANGIGFCAVSRVLRWAQFQRDIGIRDRERASGMDPKSLHIVSGVGQREIEKVLQIHKDQNIEQGYMRYNKPAIMSTVDPTRAAEVRTLDLAPRPDQWNFDEQMRWYISLLAMALGVDYQDLAPLPSRGIGGSQQSLILHEKAKGKGPELFMKTIEHIFNFHGVIPKNVYFEYDEKDPAEDEERANLLLTYSESADKLVMRGILTPQGARNVMLDAGVISQEIFDIESQGQLDATPEVQAESDVNVVTQPDEQIAQVQEKKIAFSPFAHRDRLKWERQMMSDIGKALNKSFRDLKGRILGKKALGLNYGLKQELGDILESKEYWDGFRNNMTEAMSPNARQVFLGAVDYNNKLGLAVDMEAMNQAVFDFTRQYTTAWVNSLEQTTREGLNKAILAWQEGGLGTEGLPDLVNSLKPMFGDARAQRIAATETARVFDLGNLEAHRSAGIEYEQWQTANDDLVRDEHQELEGQVFALNEGPRPSDFINCRCARVPIPTEEAEAILGRRG